MAINLNIEKYGAQFQMFAAFAAQHQNPDFVARVERLELGQPLIGQDGAARRIVAKDWDGSGQIWRRKGSRDVNNEIRTLFMQTILAVCGVKSKEELPPSVRDVFRGGGRFRRQGPPPHRAPHPRRHERRHDGLDDGNVWPVRTLRVRFRCLQEEARLREFTPECDVVSEVDRGEGAFRDGGADDEFHEGRASRPDRRQPRL